MFLTMAILFTLFAAISPVLYEVLVLNAHLRGLPLPFAFMGEGCKISLTGCSADFFWINFVLDLIFWYLAAGFLSYLNESIRKG